MQIALVHRKGADPDSGVPRDLVEADLEPALVEYLRGRLQAVHPRLPPRVVLDRSRGGAYASMLIASGLGRAALTAQALAHGYDTAFWWTTGVFAFGAVVGGALLRRGPLYRKDSQAGRITIWTPNPDLLEAATFACVISHTANAETPEAKVTAGKHGTIVPGDGMTYPNSNLCQLPAFAGAVLGCLYPYDVKGAVVTLGGV